MAGVWGARQWLRITKEATWGTYDASATEGNIHWIRAAQDNFFTMQPAPVPYDIMSADALNEIIQTDSEQILVTGTLITPLYASQAQSLTDWATKLRSTGTPATYSLDSFTVDHFDGIRTRRYLGTRVTTWNIAGSNSAPVILLSLGLQAWKPDTSNPTLAEPAESVFPTTLPFTFQKTAGTLKIGSATARTNYQSLTLQGQNTLDGQFCEDQYVAGLEYCGRRMSVQARAMYKSGEVDRLAFESQSAQANCEVTFTRGSSTLKFDFAAKCRIIGHEVDAPMSAVKYVNLDIKSVRDASAGTSLTVTVA